MSHKDSAYCFKIAPQSLFENLALIFRSWLFHGNVTRSILVCAFIPLIKKQLEGPVSE